MQASTQSSSWFEVEVAALVLRILLETEAIDVVKLIGAGKVSSIL